MSKQERPKKTKKRILLEYGITFGVCALLTFVWMAASGIFSSYEAVNEMYQRPESQLFTSDLQKNLFLSINAFFGIGIICAGFGLIVMASNGGAFEMLVYGTKRFISLFRKDPNKFKYKTFYDYHAARSAEPKFSFAYMLIVGGVFLVVSFVLLIIYMQ